MTAFEWVKANSTLSVGTFFEHLKNPSGEGGGAGETVYIIAEGFDVDCIQDTFDADLDILTISADMIIDTYDVVDFDADDLSADLENINLDGDLT